MSGERKLRRRVLQKGGRHVGDGVEPVERRHDDLVRRSEGFDLVLPDKLVAEQAGNEYQRRPGRNPAASRMTAG
jgi:hypothetical protein